MIKQHTEVKKRQELFSDIQGGIDESLGQNSIFGWVLFGPYH